MILRGIAARRLPSCTLFLLASCVVAGTVVAVGFGRVAAVPDGSAGALVLLGLVAVASQSAEAVRRREHELALARMRGRQGLRLLLFAIGEPSVVLLGGAVVGVVAGWLVARAAVSAWLPPGTTYRLGSVEWIAAALVTAASIAVVVLSSWGMFRLPLHEQLAGVRRPAAVSTLGRFLQLVLVLGGGVAVYQAHQDATSRVDWVTLVSPAVVGLAAGQLLMWLLMGVLGVLVPRSGGISLGWFITLRRVLRRADGLGMIRIVVAAGVVFGVAASAGAAAQTWREDRARLQTGGPTSYPVAGGALAAFAAATRADPQGRWLLPMASYTQFARPAARRVFVDTSRWENVVGDFFGGATTAPLTKALRQVPSSPDEVFGHGHSVTATVETASLERSAAVALGLVYVDDHGNLSVLRFLVRAADGQPAGPGLTRLTTALPGCMLACSMVELDIHGYTHGPLTITSLDVGGQQVLAPAAGLRPVDGHLLSVRRSGDGLSIVVPKSSSHRQIVVGTFRSSQIQPAVVTPGVVFDRNDGRRTVDGIDGSPRPVETVAEVPALPFVGTRGAVLDLSRMLKGSGGSIPGTKAVVVARSDTPASVDKALRATGAVGPPTTYVAALTRLNRGARAEGTRLYLLIAAFAALVALVSLASGVAQQRPERRQEAASMRSVGVPTREINGAYRREALLLAAATMAATWAASWASCRVLLGAFPLVSGWAFAPPLDASPRLGLVSVTAVVAGAALAAVTYLVYRRVGRSAAPRMLREDLV